MKRTGSQPEGAAVGPDMATKGISVGVGVGGMEVDEGGIGVSVGSAVGVGDNDESGIDVALKVGDSSVGDGRISSEKTVAVN